MKPSKLFDKTHLTSMNPQPSKLYSLIKLHKHHNSIRPVVSFVTAPSYKLSKELLTTINKYICFSPEFSVRNSIELIDKLKSFHVPNKGKLVSFDVKN